MEKGWIKIYSTPDAVQAQLVKDHLQNNDISTVLLNKKDSSYVVLGEVEVYVKRDFAVKALHLIKSFLDA